MCYNALVSSTPRGLLQLRGQSLSEQRSRSPATVPDMVSTLFIAFLLKKVLKKVLKLPFDFQFKKKQASIIENFNYFFGLDVFLRLLGGSS